MRLFTMEYGGKIEDGISGSSLKNEEQVVLWTPVVLDLDGTRISLGPMFPTIGNYEPAEPDIDFDWPILEVKGGGALLLVEVRSLNHGQIWKPNFSHQSKKPLAQVNSSVDGLPLAELWFLNSGDLLEGEEMSVELTWEGICRQRGFSQV